MIGGIFKHALWLAPTFALTFYYVASRQEQATATMEKDKLVFENQFAQNQKELSSDKTFWSDEQNKSVSKIKEAETAEKVAKARSAEMMKSLDQEVNGSDTKGLPNLPPLPK